MAEWVGRSVERDGALTPELAGMLSVAVGHDLAVSPDLTPGTPMPYLWHWAAFPEFVPMSGLGTDGHPKLGGFLPPVPLERRLWASGSLAFSGHFRIGERLHKRSEIVSVDEKSGSGGTMVFVSVAHHLEGTQGGRIDEQQNIVYLAIPDAFRPPKPLSEIVDPDFAETVEMSEARLFRYSAATFNAHRIHYDRPYSRDIEKYPGLVVHGPLQATLLMEAGTRHRGAPPSRFSFRAVHPMFHHDGLRLLGRITDQGSAMDLCTAADAGHQGMQARMEWNTAP